MLEDDAFDDNITDNPFSDCGSPRFDAIND